MQLPQFYRSFELAWEVDPEDQRRFRRFLLIGLLLVLLLGAIVPFIELPKRGAVPEEVPPQLAKLMQQELPKPPPPKPQPKVEKPKPEPVQQPKPVDTRKKMENTAAMRAIKDELADLRDQVDTSTLRNRQLSAAVDKDARSERSLITSKVGAGSAGIVSANSSRGFGSGAGALSDHNTVGVTSSIASNGGGHATRVGKSGKAARSQEEIELVFDRNKGAIYALYTRAMRERADLQGKVVLSLTISPAGDVTDCSILSSELNDPDLEHKIVARVKLFKFEAKDVETITARKTIEFFPG